MFADVARNWGDVRLVELTLHAQHGPQPLLVDLTRRSKIYNGDGAT